MHDKYFGLMERFVSSGGFCFRLNSNWLSNRNGRRNGFFYLIGTGSCLYCLNIFLFQISYFRITPLLFVPFQFNVFVGLQALLFLLLPEWF